MEVLDCKIVVVLRSMKRTHTGGLSSACFFLHSVQIPTDEKMQTSQIHGMWAVLLANWCHIGRCTGRRSLTCSMCGNSQTKALFNQALCTLRETFRASCLAFWSWHLMRMYTLDIIHRKKLLCSGTQSFLLEVDWSPLEHDKHTSGTLVI